MRVSDYSLKRILLLIWACWSLFVTLSNICDGLKTLYILPASFKFVSGNFGYIQAATQIYSFPAWLNALLFIIVIAWEAAMCFFFFKSFFMFSEVNPALIIKPFLFGITLFGGFLVSDEILITYDRLGAIEQSHLGFFTGLLISLLVMRLLPFEK
jgi:hypothetical protein